MMVENQEESLIESTVINGLMSLSYKRREGKLFWESIVLEGKVLLPFCALECFSFLLSAFSEAFARVGSSCAPD